MDALLALQEREAAVVRDFNSEVSNAYKRLNERLCEINDARHSVLNGVRDEELGPQTRGVAHRGTILEGSVTALDDTSGRLQALALDTLGSSASRVYAVARPLATPRWPNFWLQALLGCSITRQYVTRRDEKILSHLDNFKAKVFDSNERVQEFELSFYFTKNPYFTNEHLSRTFYLDDVKGESHSTTIDWLPLGEQDMEAIDSDEDYYEEEEKGGDYNEDDDGKRYRATFFDFFYNSDTDEDFDLAAALLLKVYRSPLKYVARYLTGTGTGTGTGDAADATRPTLDGAVFKQLVEIAGEASDYEDENFNDNHGHGQGEDGTSNSQGYGRGSGTGTGTSTSTSTRPGGRYPFSWVLDIWKAYNRVRDEYMPSNRN